MGDRRSWTLRKFKLKRGTVTRYVRVRASPYVVSENELCYVRNVHAQLSATTHFESAPKQSFWVGVGLEHDHKLFAPVEDHDEVVDASKEDSASVAASLPPDLSYVCAQGKQFHHFFSIFQCRAFFLIDLAISLVETALPNDAMSGTGLTCRMAGQARHHEGQEERSDTQKVLDL